MKLLGPFILITLVNLSILPLIPKVESSEILEPATFIKSFSASIKGSPDFDNNPVTIPDKSELSFYNITVLFSPTSHSATGWANVSFLNTENVSLDHVFFHLWPMEIEKIVFGAMEIHSIVNCNNTALEYEIIDVVNMKVNLTETVLPEQRYLINIKFTTTLPANNPVINGRCSYETTPHAINSFANWHPVLSVYENAAWNMNPSAIWGETFYADVAYYAITIKTPKNEIISAGGELQSLMEINTSFNEYYWTAGPIRDFTWVASPDYTIAYKLHNGINISSFYFPEHETHGKEVLNITANCIDLFSELFEPYPYESVTVVDHISGVAMEYHQLVMIGSNFYTETANGGVMWEFFPSPPYLPLGMVLVHELSHIWNTFIVGNNPYKDPWLDEAWADYSMTVLYLERYHGESAVKKVLDQYKTFYFSKVSTNTDKPISQSVGSSQSEEDYFRRTYGKGSFFLDVLRYIMGDEAFFTAIETYYEEFSFKTVTEADFIRVFVESSGMDLQWLFDQYVYGSGYSLYTLSLYTEPAYNGSNWQLQFTVNQTAPSGPMKMLVPFKVELYNNVSDSYSDKNYFTWINLSTQVVNVNINTSLQPVRIVLDPEWQLIREKETIELSLVEEEPANTTTTTTSVTPAPGFTIVSLLFTSLLIGIVTFRKRRC